jgi:FkbM family methyltransferase
MYLGLFEPAETRMITRLLRSGDIFIDVGAHIGWFTTLAANHVGHDGHVVACEPYPSNAAALRANLALNGAENVRVLEVALGSEAGTLSLASVAGESGSVTALDWAGDGRVDVAMTTLNAIAADIGNIALVKLDVEGWEMRVLSGAAEVLERVRHILVEVNGPTLRAAGSSPAELVELLRSQGFTEFRPVAQTGLRRLHRSAVSNVLASRKSTNN